ncbi:MAG: RsmE family RNA methyltransferase [Gammaproteobacteria bacterium]|nr:RsmE family RNA methyltransferase [Gammaproteobacteria bacterium]MCY4275511.1 RsmE family RNA methyltransferase [Gammaproteobacteria bacterium]
MRVDSTPIYLNPIPEPGSHGVIAGPEALHASKSRRLVVGDNLYLMDGKGTKALARILDQSLRGDVLNVQIMESDHFTETVPQLTLASAIAKGERQSTLLSMAVQAGMNNYVPLEYEHSAVYYSSKMQKRWDNVILQSCKQCRRPYIPTFRPSMSFKKLCELNRESGLKGRCLMIAGDSEGESLHSMNFTNLHNYEEIILIIGPEGGYSRSEKQLITDQKILKLCLSDHILRIETAAIAICAVVHQQIISKL